MKTSRPKTIKFRGAVYRLADAQPPSEVQEVAKAMMENCLFGGIVNYLDYPEALIEYRNSDLYAPDFCVDFPYIQIQKLPELDPNPIWTISDNYERFFSATFIYVPSTNKWFYTPGRWQERDLPQYKPLTIDRVLANAMLVMDDLDSDDYARAKTFLKNNPKVQIEFDRLFKTKMNKGYRIYPY